MCVCRRHQNIQQQTTDNINFCAPDEFTNMECESLPSITIPDTAGTQSCGTLSVDWEDMNFEVGKSVEGGITLPNFDG